MASQPVREKDHSPPEVDRVWSWVYDNEIPIYPVFYLLKGDYNPNIYPSMIPSSFPLSVYNPNHIPPYSIYLRGTIYRVVE